MTEATEADGPEMADLDLAQPGRNRSRVAGAIAPRWLPPRRAVAGRPSGGPAGPEPRGTSRMPWGSRFLCAAALAWLATIWLAPFGLASGRPRAMRLAALAGYAAGARVCHQRADRSFRVAGRSMPVCARCAGLYTAAPLGVLLAFRRGRAARAWPTGRWRAAVATAATPTVFTLVAEWAGAGVGAHARFGTALPLGVTVAFLLTAAAEDAEDAWRS